MKYTKSFIILLISALLLIISSCGAMMESTEDVTIDLSALSSPKATGIEYVKIWLAGAGTNNFYDLDVSDTEKYHAFIELSAEKTATLNNIPAGTDFDIYISKGSSPLSAIDAEDAFVAEKYLTGTINVAGGGSTAESMEAHNLVAVPYSQLLGFNLNGVAIIDGTLHTVDADGTKLYHGAASGTSFATEAQPAGFTLNNVSEGMGNLGIVSTGNSGGEGFLSFDGTFHTDFADGLATELDSDAVNILSADVFWDADAPLELIVGHTGSGFVLGLRTSLDVPDEWIPLDMGPVLEEAGVPLSGTLISGITVVKRYSAADEVEALWIYLITKAGNFRLIVPVSSDSFDLNPEGEETEEDVLLELFKAFKLTDADGDEYKILNIGTPDDETLFIGTTQGLLTAEVTDELGAMVVTEIADTAGEKIEILACSTSYTACVTPLKLIIVNSDGEIASVPFNAGLPSTDILVNGGITGLDWNGSTLYIAGNNGLAALNVSTLTFE